MANQYLLIKNPATGQRGDNALTIIGTRQITVGGNPMWVVFGFHDLKPEDVAEAEHTLINQGYTTIVDVPAGAQVCFRVEYRILRCRAEVPGDIDDADVIEPTRSDNVLMEHPGFHPMCECGSNWVSCDHDPPANCCG